MYQIKAKLILQYNKIVSTKIFTVLKFLSTNNIIQAGLGFA